MNITKDQIARVAEDGFGNWHVWVTLSPSEARILKFKKKPTVQDVIDAASRIVLTEEKPVDQLQARLNEIDRQLTDLQAEKAQIQLKLQPVEVKDVVTDA